MKEKNIRKSKNQITMKRIKKEVKGITLIALVVTIIVLLILASVAISLTIGNNGIFTRAGNATDKWKEASENEQKEMGKAEDVIDDYISNNIEAPEMTLVDMLKKAEEDGCINENGTCQDKTHLHIGDYVNFQNPENGEYIVKADKSGISDYKDGNINGITDQKYTITKEKNKLNWRVLGIDKETGGIKLTSGRPLMSDNVVEGEATPFLILYGARGYVEGQKELDNICITLYKDLPLVASVRSINAEDINELTGVKTEEDIKKYNMVYSETKQYGEKYSAEDIYTPESWIENRKINTEENVTGYSYYIVDYNNIPDGIPEEIKNYVPKIENSRIIDIISKGACNPGSYETPYYFLNTTSTMAITENNKDRLIWGLTGIYGFPRYGHVYAKLFIFTKWRGWSSNGRSSPSNLFGI